MDPIIYRATNYGLIYNSDFRDVNDELWRLNIYKDNYTGGAKDLTLASDPVKINYTTDDIFKPIKYSGCTINILTPEILKLLYTGEVLDVKIEILKYDSNTKKYNLFWKGFNSPNIYNLEFYSDLDSTSIEALDSLSVLKNYKYNTNKFSTDLRVYVYRMWDEGFTTPTITHTYQLVKDRCYVVSYRVQEGSIKIVFKINLNQYTFDASESNISDTVESFNNNGSGIESMFTEGRLLFSYSNGIEISFEVQSILNYWFTDNTNLYEEKYFIDYIREILALVNDSSFEIWYMNSLDVGNPHLLEELKVDERAFFNESDDPLYLSEVLELIFLFLGITCCQFEDKYLLYDAISYSKGGEFTICKYKSDGTVSTALITNTPLEVEVKENISTVSYDDVYNLINVVASLQYIDDYESIPDFLLTKNRYLTKDVYEIIYPYRKEEDGKKKRFYMYYYIKNFKSNIADATEYKFNETVVDTFYRNVYDESGSLIEETIPIKKVNYTLESIDPEDKKADIIKSCYHEGEDPYPHPSWETYFSLKTDYLSSSVEGIKKSLLVLPSMPLLFKYKSKQSFSFFSSAAENIYMTIDGEAMLSDLYYHNVNLDDRLFEVEKKYYGFNILDAVLKIGDKYWNGSEWTTDYSKFPIGIGTFLDNKVKTNLWYSFTDTTDFKLDLDIHGKLITIKPSDNLSGTIELELYPYNYTERFKIRVLRHLWSEINGVDLGESYWEDPIMVLNYSDVLSNPTIFDPYRLNMGSDGSQDGNDYYAIYECSILNGFVPFSEYLFLKDLKFEFATVSGDFFKEEKIDEIDLKYSRIIDENNVKELSDITLSLNTYNPDFNIPLSFSYVIKNDGEYLQLIMKDGYYIRPEEHIVRNYAEHYGKQRLIHNNIFKTNDVNPLGSIWVPYLDNPMMIGDLTYSIQFNTMEVKAYEV